MSEGVMAVVIHATPDGGSALSDLHLPLCHKQIAADGSSRWEGVSGATGWGITSGQGDGYETWHVSAMPGLSIVLSGAWEIEASNGDRRILSTGDVLVMLDTTGRGHRSRQISAPCAVIGIGFDAATHQQIAAQVMG
jgi:uncharacterized protein YjlB